MESKRIEFIDYLNIFCCLSVIALHCNGCFWNFSYERYWITSVFIECIFYFAVPVFFMISGVNLIDYRDKYDIKMFLKKRLVKIFIPFLFWSIVWILITKQYRGKDLLDILEIIVHTKAQGVYWFFIPLFSVYLSIPIFGLIDKDSRKYAYEYIVGLSILFVATLPLVCNLLKISYNYGLVPYISAGYLMYPLMGWLFFNCYKFTFRQRKIIYVVGLIGLLTRLLTVLFWSLDAGKIINVMGGYTALPTVAYSMAVFIFFQYDLEKIINLDWLRKFDLSKIAVHSFGGYLFHMFFIIVLPRVFHFSNLSIYWRTIGVLVVYFLCLLVVIVCKKIPFLKRVV